MTEQQGQTESLTALQAAEPAFRKATLIRYDSFTSQERQGKSP